MNPGNGLFSVRATRERTPNSRLRILITNNTLADRAGSELYARDLAAGLLARQHTPVAYSTRLGEVAKDIRAAGITVTDELDTLTESPEIIHGHHHLHTMTALLRFPDTPAIYICHGSTPWEEAAPCFPRILRYVAVDRACRDRLVLEDAIPEERIRVLFNFVDLERFQPRPELPNRPQRALIFSNYANECTHIEGVRSACDRANIHVDVVGKGVGNVSTEPEAVLGNYDIVFAKGRAALEALAVGTAVILCDATGAGPMVTTKNVLQLRPFNFGMRALREAVSSEVISREIARYDPADAQVVSRTIRAIAGREAVLDELISLYEEVVDEYRMLSNDLIAEQRAVATYLRKLSPQLTGIEYLAASELEAKEAELRRLETMASRQVAAKENELQMIKNSRTWRLMSRYAAIKHRLLLPTYDRVSGLLRAREYNETHRRTE